MTTRQGGGIFAKGDAAAKGRFEGFMTHLGGRHPISWGLARGTGLAAYGLAVRLPNRAFKRGRGAYRSWLATTERTVVADLTGGRAGAGASPTPAPAPPGGPGLATVTDINTKRPATAQPRAAATAQKGTVSMSQAVTELAKHPVGKLFARLAESVDVFDPGAQYRHAMLVEFAAEVRAGLDVIAAALDEYAQAAFTIGLDKRVLADVYAAVSAAESVMESAAATKTKTAGIYADIIDQETSRAGTVSVDGSVGTGATGTAKVAGEIAAYFAAPVFTEGTEASQILADLRAAQRGYAALQLAVDEFARRLGKASFHAKVVSGFLLVSDDCAAAATAMRRACRAMTDTYAPQLRHEARGSGHLRAI